MASEGFHEAEDRLRPETKDMHRALVSLTEELEAIDWYQQRMDVTEDAELRAILAHNREEEQEHASMLMAWIRRRDPQFAGHMRAYVFSEGPIGGRDAGAGVASARGPAPSTVGSLRGDRR